MIVLFTGLMFFFSACSPTLQDEPTAILGIVDLMVSKTPDRLNAEALDGASVSGKIYVFINIEDGVEQVDFYLNDPERTGPPYQRERHGFYDFAGTASTGEANAFDTTTLPDGVHTITAAVLLTTEKVITKHATFAVNNGDNILWSADHELGDFSQWKAEGYDGIWISGKAKAEITTQHARSGKYSAALTVFDAAGGSTPGVRLAKTQTESSPPLPEEAYYSAWYYFPQQVQVTQWWIIFQFKQHGTSWGSDPTYTINVDNRTDGRMNLYAYRHIGNDGGYMTRGHGVAAQADTDIPTGRWWHLECYYKWSRDSDGHLTCWQDGTLIWDLQNIRTEYDYGWPRDGRPYQWTVNNYTAGTSPSSHTIYVDDAAISRTRIGSER